MRPRVVAISIIAHAAVIGGLLAIPAHRSVEPQATFRDIEVIAAPPPDPPSPPPPPPPIFTEPMRDRAPTRMRRPSHGGGLARGPDPTQPAGNGEGTGTGSGSDNGSGNGDGDDGEVLVPIQDRSGPPVPIDIIAARTLPYTAEAQRDHVSGDVVLMLEIDAQGRVERSSVTRGLGHGLDEIATRVALELRFRPATNRIGTPITGRVKWRFHFQPP